MHIRELAHALCLSGCTEVEAMEFGYVAFFVLLVGYGAMRLWGRRK